MPFEEPKVRCNRANRNPSQVFIFPHWLHGEIFLTKKPQNLLAYQPRGFLVLGWN